MLRRAVLALLLFGWIGLARGRPRDLPTAPPQPVRAGYHFTLAPPGAEPKWYALACSSGPGITYRTGSSAQITWTGSSASVISSSASR